VRAVLLAGVLPDPRLSDWTPLHFAVFADRLTTARILLAHGADVDAAGQNGERPLHLAARQGSTSLIQELLANGADVSAEDLSGREPLFPAAEGGSASAVLLLVAHGASLAVTSSGNDTILAAACRMGRGEVVSTLLALGPGAKRQINDAAFKAAWGGHAEILSALLREGANPNRDVGRTTLLHAAVKGRSVETVAVLLSARADVNPRDQDGKCPLHYAAADGAEAIVRALLKHGADTSAKDGDGFTPADLARLNQDDPLRALLTTP
jgi:ankyrin repeat protein